jgi:hypothetical protein
MRAFIKIVLKYNPSSDGPDKDGVLGRCEGYYGMVEAQGRGTFHCHLLVWLAGNPTPHELRERMRDCQLPRDDVPIVETDGPLKPPACDPGVLDPRLHKRPYAASMSEDEFESQFQKTVEQLVIESKWHIRKETCWKHLKRGEARVDKNCRMRIDEDINPFTRVDSETESIILKRLHPRINNYHGLIMFLLRCNMDIKYIGSGEATKASVHYITDYITKSTLGTHVGLSAVKYAIKRKWLRSGTMRSNSIYSMPSPAA